MSLSVTAISFSTFKVHSMQIKYYAAHDVIIIIIIIIVTPCQYILFLMRSWKHWLHIG